MISYGLAGKKLLFLGGVQRACAIVKRAQELGVYVIVADYNEDSPAKAIANEAVLIDATDVEALVEYCLDNHVDGVTTAYADVLLKPCMEVAKRIGRPFYANDLMIELSTDKNAFKKCLSQHGVPVPKTFDVSAKDYIEKAASLPYPVFIKPVDASGSRGADVCYSLNDFCKKYEHALSFSKKKCITVEEFLEGTEFILDYILIDGEPYLLSMADRFICAGRSPAVNSPNLMILPSYHLSHYYEEVHPAVCEMIKNLGFQNGVLFFQGYAKENRITFYEMGCRLGGTWPYIDEHFTQINPIDLLISHALTGQMLPQHIDRSTISPFFNGMAAIVYFVSNKGRGKIKEITNLDILKNMQEVVCVLQNNWAGDEFETGRFTDVRFLAIHLVAPNYEALNNAVKRIYEKIDFIGTDGESLLCSVVYLDDVTDFGKRICYPIRF